MDLVITHELARTESHQGGPAPASRRPRTPDPYRTGPRDPSPGRQWTSTLHLEGPGNGHQEGSTPPLTPPQETPGPDSLGGGDPGGPRLGGDQDFLPVLSSGWPFVILPLTTALGRLWAA